MKNIIKQKGFTLYELLFAIVGVAGFAFCIWLLSLIVRALLKYVGS